MSANTIKNIFTVDVEDYFMASVFEKVAKRNEWGSFEGRVISNTRRILTLLSEFNTHATFFVVGWVAEHYPQLLKEIAQGGHEIGCHSYTHKLIYELGPEDFRKDLRRAKRIIEEAAQKPVVSFRAPNYSITQDSLWAFDILAEEGFRNDSSIYPIHHDRGGLPHANRFYCKIEKGGKEIIEIPLSTIRLAGMNIPVGGGGYFRLAPYWFTKAAVAMLNRQEQPLMLYIHPWELDPGQPRLGIKGMDRFRHYVNLRTTETKLKRLLGDFVFVSLEEFVTTLPVEREQAQSPSSCRAPLSQ